MCGLCGVVTLTRPEAAAQTVVEQMNATMFRRGPDESGTYFYTPREPGREPYLALGHRRLSIIDLSTGRQPLFNEDHSIAVIANAEIYNWPELEPELRARGHSLATLSDCEAIAHLYEDFGLDFVHHLKGMFAIALWDSRRRRLVLARDRIGVKPLHYFCLDDMLVFASEIKALMKHPSLLPRIDNLSLYKYLTYEYVPCPATILEGVHKLEPGYLLVWEDGKVSKQQYWDLNISQADEYHLNENQCVERLDELLTQAIRRRLLSDVEVGVFLSGGVDSSLVASRAQSLYPGPMKAFTVGFEEKTFDETNYARKMSTSLGLDFHYEVLTADKLLSVIESLTDIMDEPFADSSIVPTYLLSRLASSKVKVALSGDGGDDFLAGYVTYPALKLVNYYKILPTELRKFINSAIQNMPVRHSYLSLDFKLKQFMRGAGYSSEIMFWQWMAALTDQQKSELCSRSMLSALGQASTFEDVFRYLQNSRLTRDLERILYLMIKLYLQDGILVKVDRASMACSLEVRSPFLDQDLVEFVNGLPANMKLRRLTTKYILKKVAKLHIPNEIVNRKKKGFGMPIGQWFRGRLKGMLTDYLAPRRIAKAGFFDPDAVQKLIHEHLSGQHDHRKSLWTIVVFEIWRERWVP